MTQTPLSPSIQAEWFYAIWGQAHGPVTCLALREMLQSRQLHPATPVWKAGLADWLPATSVPELIQGLDLPPKYLRTPSQLRQARIVKNAKQNAVAMFSLFVPNAIAVFATLVAAVMGVRPAYTGWVGAPAVIGGLFAVVYLPLRWRLLRSLPSPYATLGTIGGVGLIVLLVLAILGWVAILATGGSLF